MQFIGVVFEDYSFRLLSRIADSERARTSTGKSKRSQKSKPPQVKLFSETDLQQALNLPEHRRPPVCDAILLIRNTVCLFECKAKLFSVAARSGVEAEEFFQRMKEIAVEGARQLSSTVSLISDGAFRDLGLDPARIEHAFPVIVSLQDVLMNPLLKDWLRDLWREEGYLQPPTISRMNVYEFEFFDPGDLEWLEFLVETGASTRNLLVRKQSNSLDRGHSFWSWITVRGLIPQNRSKMRLNYHASVFEKLSEGALNFFKAHADV